jgi:bacillithiol biosynthesis deacetylase BshB1
MTLSAEPFDALFVGPHPDDVDLFCGGTVARLAALGRRVLIVDLSRGELATRGDPATREAEARLSAERLGAAERRCLGLPDGHLDARDAGQVGALVDVLRAARPSVVIAPAAIDRHPDHEAAHHLVRRASFLAGLVRHAPAAGAPHRPSTLLFYPLHTHLRADLCIDTSDTFKAKRFALDAFASQLSPSTADAATVLTSETYLAALEARDRTAGALIGVATAEPFLAEAPARLSDPMDATALYGASTAWRQEPRR